MPDISAEAISAARDELWRLDGQGYAEACRSILAAALPHLRAQVLAEVDAALRDEGRWAGWYSRHPIGATMYGPNVMAAGYLRDTLAGDGGENERPAQIAAEPSGHPRTPGNTRTSPSDDLEAAK